MTPSCLASTPIGIYIMDPVIDTGTEVVTAENAEEYLG
jgi:hypothetical protein